MKLATLFIFGCTLLSAQPAITISPSPNPNVILIPIVAPPELAETSRLFAGDVAKLRSAAFFVSNQTGQSIMAIALTCIVTDGNGTQRTSQAMDDAFLVAASHPILNPGARLLVIAPNMWIPESTIPHYTESGLMTLQRASDWLGSGSVKVSIDSIVFTSGEMDGPDSLHFLEQIVSRKRAADSVLAAINAAEQAGQSPDLALSPMVAQPRQSDDDGFSRWQSTLARQYIGWAAAHGRSAARARLQFPPLPPLFHGLVTQN